MYEIAETAGFHGAHAIWSVSDSEGLTPVLGCVEDDGTEGLERFAFDDVADAVRVGGERLREGRPGRVRAAFVVDAFLHLPRGRTDALIIDAVEYAPRRRSIRIAVPYRPHNTAQGFAVYRPKFLETSGFTDPDYETLGAAFYAGVDSHEQAAAVWNAHLLDESA
ncbi:hypothetical protein ACFYTS_06590 [Nocardia sp. NPDC004151]|uniref:hypothetical protein n=1 Tax=Nocardia sp. NPDC004151 TaxID=3364304 RepID=UPI0036A403BF